MLDLGLCLIRTGRGKEGPASGFAAQDDVVRDAKQSPLSPQWARDVDENEPVQWLLFGMRPSRARLYDFRDRIAPFLREWNAQVLQVAVEEHMTPATRPLSTARMWRRMPHVGSC